MESVSGHLRVEGCLPYRHQHRLATGLLITIVPVTPAVREDLREGFARLSPKSRYQRFLSPLSHLTPGMLDYLTAPDFQDHMAFCAGVEGREDYSGVGLIRCVRAKDDPEVAEVAITVIDEYQHQGVGRLLLECLARYARSRGIKRLRGSYLSDNHAIKRLLERYSVSSRPEGPGVRQFEVDIDSVLHWCRARAG